MTSHTLLTVEVRGEQDLVVVRQRARQIAGQLGLTGQELTALATAVSEIVRNALIYAGGGRVEYMLALDGRPQTLLVRTADQGPGIAQLDAVLNGQYVSTTGLGLGMLGAQRLSDVFDVRSAPGQGTTVTLGKHLPRRPTPLTPLHAAELAGELARLRPQGAFEEIQEQNRELLLAMDALRVRQAEVERLNAELAETNRGVVALYAELDDRAESLRRASEYKSRFLSDMTHELRTPLNAVISLSRLLLDHVDGSLTPEQERQVMFIHRSASGLGEMVNGLLDLAKIESGRIDIRPEPFDVADLFSALRGVFRAISGDARVTLTIEDPAIPITMRTDEGKVTQILRNLLSNALKFTESGSVRLSAEQDERGIVFFRITDTGIGIAQDNLERIFEDFTQIDSSVQRRVRGTGLGLPLTRKLCELLGGDVRVCSTPGVGTTFTVTLPAELPERIVAPDGRVVNPLTQTALQSPQS